MKRLIFIVVFSMLAVSCVIHNENRPTIAKPPIVFVCSADKMTGELLTCGRGFSVSDVNGIITAGHVASSMFDTVVISGDKRFFVDSSKIVNLNDKKVLDLAVIVDDFYIKSDVSLCPPMFGDYEDVIIWRNQGPTRGSATGLSRSDVMAFPPTEKGDSGSPVVSIDRGCVIGLVSTIFYYKDKDGKRENHHTVLTSSQSILFVVKHLDTFFPKQEDNDAGQNQEQQDAGE